MSHVVNMVDVWITECLSKSLGDRHSFLPLTLSLLLLFSLFSLFSLLSAEVWKLIIQECTLIKSVSQLWHSHPVHTSGKFCWTPSESVNKGTYWVIKLLFTEGGENVQTSNSVRFVFLWLFFLLFPKEPLQMFPFRALTNTPGFVWKFTVIRRY